MHGKRWGVKMEIKVAKTAGFCFGVNRAVELTYGLLARGRVATLGPLIHNPQAWRICGARGPVRGRHRAQVPTAMRWSSAATGYPAACTMSWRRAASRHDATCPFVQKIQRIAARAEKEGAVLLVAGDKPTRRCRASWDTPGAKVFVFADLGVKGLERPLGPPKTPFCSCTDHISGDKMERKFGVSQKSLYKRPNF